MPAHIPRVSIGLPVYNGARYLPAALDSLLAQTWTDFEIVISDNASTDDTQFICRKYAERDARIRYHRAAENGGLAWNFNRVFELSVGEYFKWAAADDVCGPTFLEDCVAILDGRPDVVLASPRAGVIDADGRLIVAEESLPSDDRQQLTDAGVAGRVRYLESVKPAARYAGVLLHSTRCYEEFGLIRASAMRRTGLHGTYRGAEKVWLAEMSLLGRFCEVPQILYFCRWHDQRFSAISSAAVQKQAVTPKAKGRWAMPRQLRCTHGYAALIVNAPLGLADKLRCGFVLLRYLVQFRKLKRVLREAVGGGMTAVLPKNISTRGTVAVAAPAQGRAAKLDATPAV